MSLSNIIFLDNLPKIDLHGCDRDTARVLINDFIIDNIKLKKEVIIIIHGIGSGILKKGTNEVLKKHKMVVEYQTSFFNPGCTIVKLKI